MAEKITKCPVCTTRLKMINGRMTCKSCGYFIWHESTFSQTTSNRTTSKVKRSVHGDHWIAVATACLILLAGVGIAVTMQLLDNNRPEYDRQTANNASSSRNSTSGSRNQSASADQELSSPVPATEQPQAEQHLPQSEYFQELSQVIWGKEYETISPEEYSSLISLEITNGKENIEYELADGTRGTFSLPKTTIIDLADLSCFTNLEWIYIPDFTLHKGYLDGLDNLYCVVSKNTIEECLDIIPHPEDIRRLGIEDHYNMISLAGIESFPNLVYLIVNDTALKDISALEQVPWLQGLELKNCFNLTDYSSLSSLTNLASLSINSSTLDSITFLQNMPNLTSLTIEGSNIESIDLLSYCPELTYLTLVRNYDLEDYSVIGELTQLEELNITYPYYFESTLPSFEKLTALQYLTIVDAYDLSPLENAVSVTHLSLGRCSSEQLEVLTAMQNLEALELLGFDIMESLELLTRLPRLQYLDLSRSYINSNIEELFAIPTLRYLSLDDCHVVIDFDNLTTVNPMLESLSMDRLTICDKPYDYWSEVELRDHVDMFALFPNLTELYVAFAGLDDITFVENLPNLQFLDITDNIVTSLEPLESLDHFIAVWCGENNILESVPEDSSFQVITTKRN